MAASSTSLTNPKFLQSNGENYNYWAITMKTLFYSQDILNLVENWFQKLVDTTTYNALTQAERDLLRDNTRKDYKTLFYIFQVVHESIFPKIAETTNSKKSWDIP